MSAQSNAWSDLTTRLVTGVLLAAVGLSALYLGGLIWTATLTVAVGAMSWELARLTADEKQRLPLLMGLVGAGSLVLALGPFGQMALVVPSAIGIILIRRDMGIFVLYQLAIMQAGFTLIGLRVDAGLVLAIWLVLVVIASDVAGYFAGRAIGGPKFWPRVSPKKTWSGTVAGWLAAALVGWAFKGATLAGDLLPALSVLTAFAAQMGDIAESAIKRRAGVKDSSNLLPGHGGALDRFDAMIGAALMVGVVWLVAPGLF